jgi:hypothetical protein
MSRPAAPTFNDTFFPSLYRAADVASAKAQRRYLRWIATNIVLMIVGAGIGSMPVAGDEGRQAVRSVSATCLILSLGVSGLLAAGKWERTWFAARAVAESVKSLSWKFVAGSEPFPSAMKDTDAEFALLGAMRELLKARPHLGPSLRSEHGGQITPVMSKLRAAPPAEIRDAYDAERVEEQRRWYAGKAATNAKSRTTWFALFVAFQSLAVVFSVRFALNPSATWPAPALFTTLASTAAAWGQVKRFQEHAQAYGYAADELSMISTRSRQVATRADLGRFVNDAETAISREHSSWVARREK